MRLRASTIQSQLELLAADLTDGGCTLSADVQSYQGGAYVRSVLTGTDSGGALTG
ncbi:MAG: hypothetical protein H6736_12775 [Alphaproteobacteria bacterium]|nr:hypothetical protein [Alphaproteobacteria bacterium]